MSGFKWNSFSVLFFFLSVSSGISRQSWCLVNCFCLPLHTPTIKIHNDDTCTCLGCYANGGVIVFAHTSARDTQSASLNTPSMGVKDKKTVPVSNSGDLKGISGGGVRLSPRSQNQMFDLPPGEGNYTPLDTKLGIGRTGHYSGSNAAGSRGSGGVHICAVACGYIC